MDKEELIKAFRSVTGASEEDSKKYLETHNYDIDMATALFLEQQDMYEPENDDEVDDEDYDHQVTTQGGHNNAPSIQPQPTPTSTSTSKPNPKRKAAPRGGMRTLADLKGDEDSSGDEDDHEDYYAGGGERSGQMIQAPKGKGNKPTMKGVFDAAKQQGAEEVEEKSSKSKSPSFGGTGYTLGDGTTHSQAHRPPPSQQRVQITRNIIFWQNGFSVDDGPLRKMDDPANRQFLASVQRGEVPQELEEEAKVEGGKLHINLVDNHSQEYKEPPKPKIVAFSGSGHTLGATSTPVPTSSTTTPSPSTQPAQAVPRRSLYIDESKPTTSIQIRLADGTRMVSKFNHDHTIQDIRNFIDAARRQSPQDYDLITTFPQKTLSNFSQTITEAGLLNAVVVQKYK